MNDRHRSRTSGPRRFRHPVEPRSRMISDAAPALETLKLRLLAQELVSVKEPELRGRLRVASNESAALAWTTPFPLLTLPELLAEKWQQARKQFAHQQTIRARVNGNISFAA